MGFLDAKPASSKMKQYRGKGSKQGSSLLSSAVRRIILVMVAIAVPFLILHSLPSIKFILFEIFPSLWSFYYQLITPRNLFLLLNLIIITIFAMTHLHRQASYSLPPSSHDTASEEIKHTNSAVYHTNSEEIKPLDHYYAASGTVMKLTDHYCAADIENDVQALQSSRKIKEVIREANHAEEIKRIDHCGASDTVMKLTDHCGASDTMRKRTDHCGASDTVWKLTDHCGASDTVRKLTDHCGASDTVMKLTDHCGASDTVMKLADRHDGAADDNDQALPSKLQHENKTEGATAPASTHAAIAEEEDEDAAAEGKKAEKAVSAAKSDANPGSKRQSNEADSRLAGNPVDNPEANPGCTRQSNAADSRLAEKAVSAAKSEANPGSTRQSNEADSRLAGNPIDKPLPFEANLSLDIESIVSEEGSIFKRDQDRPLPSARFTHKIKAGIKMASNERSHSPLGVKRGDTLDATWKAICEKKRYSSPLNRHHNHTRKTDNGGTNDGINKTRGSPSSPTKQRSHMLNSSPDHLARVLRKREPTMPQEELNAKVESFISRFNEQIKIEREQSLLKYMAMVDRGAS